MASRQIPDAIIHEGDTLSIYSIPLEQYLESKGNRELIDFSGCGSTACIRGYRAIWELRRDSLFLRAISSCHRECDQEIKNANLKKMFGTDDVFASWFTGELLIVHGPPLALNPKNNTYIFEKEFHLSMQSGRVEKEKKISHKKAARKFWTKKRHRINAYKLQDTLLSQAKTNIKWDTLKKPNMMHCYGEFSLIYNSNGKLKRVWLNRAERMFRRKTFREKLGIWSDNMTKEIRGCRRIMKRALKPINISYLEFPKEKMNIPFHILFNNNLGELEIPNIS